jgi:hypothetical protein
MYLQNPGKRKLNYKNKPALQRMKLAQQESFTIKMKAANRYVHLEPIEVHEVFC